MLRLLILAIIATITRSMIAINPTSARPRLHTTPVIAPLAAPEPVLAPLTERTTPVDPAVVFEEDATLQAVRRSTARVRNLRRRARVHALQLSRSSRAAAEAVLDEARQYELALSELDDIQRSLVRAARVGMLRERRLAQRKWLAWLRRSRDGHGAA